MKNKKLNGLIILVITIVILFFVLKDNFSSTINILGNINLYVFLIGILMYVVVFSIEALISMFLVKEYKYNYRFIDAFKLSIITRFFNGVTPFSTGGRPLQIIELKKNGVRAIDGTNVVVQNFITFQTSLIIYSIVTLIINAIFKFFPTTGFLYNMTILGFVINIVILLFALVLSINKSINKRIINFFISIGSKLKLIKNKQKQEQKWKEICNDYYNAFNDFKHKKGLIIKCITVEWIALTFFYSVVICAFYSLGITITNIIPLIIASNFVFLTGCFIPIPGGSGGIEYAFMSYFSIYLKDAELSSVLIIWRFITYYFPTLVGGIVFNVRRKNQ